MFMYANIFSMRLTTILNNKTISKLWNNLKGYPSDYLQDIAVDK